MPTKILLVDDEPDVEGMVKLKMRKKIRQGEYEFIFACNGKDAIDKIKENPDIDVVVSDINMPEMDGLTLLPKLADLNPILKAIIVSAYGDMDNIRTAMNKGAFDFLTKPIDFDDLDATLNKTIKNVKQVKETLLAAETAEKNLQDSMARNHAIVNSASDPIITFNAEGVIDSYNPAMNRLFGYSHEELEGLEIKSILPDEICNNLTQNGEDAFNGTKESNGKKKDGTFFPIEIALNKFSEKGETKFAAILRDISERKKAENILKDYNKSLEHEVELRTREIKDKNNELEKTISELHETQTQLIQSERMNAIGNSVAGVMHEINNPNAAVAGAIQDAMTTNSEAKDYLLSLLPDEDKETDEIRKLTDMMEITGKTLGISLNGSERIRNIVSAFRDFTKHQQAEYHKTDMKSEIDKTIELFHYQYKDVDVTALLENELIVEGNISELNQVILNLLINAAQAGAAAIKVKSDTDQDNIFLHVADNGSGISPDVMNKIFEPFYSTKGTGNSGLGLNICKKIIEKHNGAISIKSEVGKGTIFTIRLPKPE